MTDVTSRPPRVSVLLPAFNAAEHLEASLESLLTQTFEDFELIVIDDGSTDSTPQILDAVTDPRLVRMRQPENRGYVPALNRALQAARGELIARQDADDISLPRRLQQQVEELDRRPELVLLGTAYDVIDTEGRIVTTCHPPAHDTSIRWQLLFHNAFAHSSVMFRRHVLDDSGLSYDEDYVPAEDFRLWSQLLARGHGANLEQPLVRYRVHPQQISRRQDRRQRANAERVVRQNTAALGLELSTDEVSVLRDWAFGASRPLGAAEIPLYRRSADVLAAFATDPQVDQAELTQVRRDWVRRSLGHLPTRGLPKALSCGLLPALFRVAPGTVLANVANRLLRAGPARQAAA